jgi:phage shock protein C
MENRLYRDENRKVIGGVCAGLADYFNIDDSIMRIIFVFAAVFLGTGFWLYLILWIVIPGKFTFQPGVDFSTVPADGPLPVRKAGSASIGVVIIGAILILFGTIFLLKEYDVLPDWEYHKLWPLIFVILGLAVIFGAGKKKAIPDQFENWHKETNEQTDTPENI